jgi:hypothetical protein
MKAEYYASRSCFWRFMNLVWVFMYATNTVCRSFIHSTLLLLSEGVICTVLGSIQSNTEVLLSRYRPSCLSSLIINYQSYREFMMFFWVSAPCRLAGRCHLPASLHCAKTSSSPQWKPQILQTVDATPWTKDIPFTRPLPTQKIREIREHNHLQDWVPPRYHSIRVVPHYTLPYAWQLLLTKVNTILNTGCFWNTLNHFRAMFYAQKQRM